MDIVCKSKTTTHAIRRERGREQRRWSNNERASIKRTNTVEIKRHVARYIYTA